MSNYIYDQQYSADDEVATVAIYIDAFGACSGTS